MIDSRTHIHLDLLGGLAGDMFLAAALDAGLVEVKEVEQALRALGMGPVEIVTERVIRGAIEGTHLCFQGWDPRFDADHRHLTEIRKMLAESGLSEKVKARAGEMFELLGAAEAGIHGIDIERVHFHEVGAVDSILDFVAAAFVIEKVKATWSMGEIPVGSGTIETAHGTIPVPAPATARLLEGLELRYQDVAMEFVTPTGAAILATLAEMGGERQGRVRASGFGCGTRDPKGMSNVTRMMVLEQEQVEVEEGPSREEILRLSTEIDDQSPEVVAAVAAGLAELGARDVVQEPVMMKKGRVGTRLTVLADRALEERLVRYLLEETSTFGIRREVIERWVLKRTSSTVKTPYGEVGVKVGWWGDEVLKVSPEYEDCAKVAARAGVPLAEVFLAARVAARQGSDED